MSTAAPVKQSRKAYTRAEYGYLVQHYPTQNAAACAKALGRTLGSLKSFLAQHPELRKHPRS